MSTLDQRKQSSAGLTETAAAGKQFSRRERIVWQIVAPPALGVIVMLLPPMVWDAMTTERSRYVDLSELVFSIGLYFFAASVIAGVPSILFALLMESAFARGLDPRSWSAVALAAALGAVAGLAMVTVPIGFVIGPGEAKLVAVFGVTGLAVGFMVGFVTRWRSQ